VATPRSKDRGHEVKPHAKDMHMQVLGEERRKRQEDQRLAAIAKGKGKAKASSSTPPTKKQKTRPMHDLSSSEDDRNQPRR